MFNKSHWLGALGSLGGTARKYITASKRSALMGNEIERLSNAELLVALLQRFESTHGTHTVSRYNALARQLESIHTRLTAEPISLIDVWSEYAAIASTPYKYSQFANRYSLWCKERHLKRAALNTRISIVVNHNDLPTLRKWKLSNNRRLWERAVAILAMSNGDNVASISSKIERSPQTIKKWCQIYAAGGFDQLALPRTKAQSHKITRRSQREEGQAHQADTRIPTSSRYKPSIMELECVGHRLRETLWSAHIQKFDIRILSGSRIQI